MYLLSNKTPHSLRAREKVECEATNYMLLDTLLFKLFPEKIGNGYKALLCIPTSKVDMLLDHYHASLVGCHTGVTKCYMTISDHFYCLNLAHHIRVYITGCHICQLLKAGKRFDRPFHKQINLNVPALTKVSMDIKEMPCTFEGRYMLVLLCKPSNFMVLAPLKSTRATEICDAIK